MGHKDPRDWTLPGFPVLQKFQGTCVCQVVLWVCKSCSECESHVCREHALHTCASCASSFFQLCQQCFPAVPGVSTTLVSPLHTQSQ